VCVCVCVWLFLCVWFSGVLQGALLDIQRRISSVWGEYLHHRQGSIIWETLSLWCLAIRYWSVIFQHHSTPWSIKTCHFYFLNSSVQHWLILIIFSMQHQKETRCKWLYFWPTHFNTVTTLPCEMQVIEPAVCEWCQRLRLAFALEEDILSTFYNKENVRKHVWLFERQ